ncbi:MAG TPA: PilZ domain-containing protein [Terriglobales bacterium]
MSGAAPGKKSSRSMRQFPRFQLDVRMHVHLFRNGSSTTVWGRSTSMGQEGIGATLTGEMEIGEVVGLEFNVPLSPHPLKLRAIVRYKNGFQYGFEFLAVDGTQRQAIQRALDILPAVL